MRTKLLTIGCIRITGGSEELKQLVKEQKFLYGGRILSNRGLQHLGKKVSLSNCYVISPPEDNIESIFECATKLARTYSYGGGCGTDISKLSHGVQGLTTLPNILVGRCPLWIYIP